jgi:hypothetical protein
VLPPADAGYFHAAPYRISLNLVKESGRYFPHPETRREAPHFYSQASGMM